MKMKKITIILPIHKLDPPEIIMLDNALSSVENFHNDVKLLIVLPEKLKKDIESLNLSQKIEFKIIYNTSKDTDFASQINLGIENCETEWFSILEIDDSYNNIWLKSVTEYMNTYTDVDVFLPIVKCINSDNKFLFYINDSIWAYGFSDKQGYLDNSILLEYQNYQTSGGLYRTKVIKDNGSFKNNIKLTFTYEFLLRLTNNGVNIMGVPRVGYQHVEFRENSLFWLYKNDPKMKLDEDEIKFWIETAKKEYYFKNKRDVIYKK